MSLPEPLKQLFSWIEARGLYVDTRNGRLGFLFPEAEQRAGRTDTGRPGGTDISFFAEGNVNMKYWFRHERPEVLDRLCVFAKTGGDGSMAAFWLDAQGRQKIVHLGSGSGSIMVCVLADTAIDFIRLIAIGYEELCWGENFDAPPNTDPDAGLVVTPNTEFQDWVRSTFGVAIPSKASEIVAHPDDMGSSASEDEFNRWVAENTA